MALDVRGAVLATGASTLLVFGMTEGGVGFTAPVIGSVVLGVVLLIGFFLSQRTAANPVLPLGMFAHRSRTFVFVSLLLVGALLMAMTVQVALFVQEVLGYGPLTAGLAFIPFAFALATGSAISGRLAEVVSPRWIVAGGGVILIGGFVFSSMLDEHASYLPDLLIPILVIGVGLGIVLIPLTLSVVAGVKPTEVGPLTATSLVCQTLGGPLGLAAVTAYAEMRTRSRLGSAFDTMNRSALDDAARAALGDGYTGSLLICAGLAVVVVILVVAFVKFTPEDIREGKAAEAAAQRG